METEISMTWMFLRSTGVISVVLLTVAVATGLISPVLSRPRWRLVAIASHSTASAMGVLMLAGHVAFAVADSYVDIPAWAIILPGASNWEPLWVGIGAVAFDLIVVVVISAMLRRSIPVAWRALHMFALPAWALAWGHGITSGTDAQTVWLQVIAVTCGGLVLLASVLRLVLRPRDRAGEGLTPARPVLEPQTILAREEGS